jgi:hypothetical protein
MLEVPAALSSKLGKPTAGELLQEENRKKPDFSFPFPPLAPLLRL